MFYVLYGTPFIGGEYQSEERCKTAAAVQEPYWRHQYGKRLSWKCERERL